MMFAEIVIALMSLAAVITLAVINVRLRRRAVQFLDEKSRAVDELAAAKKQMKADIEQAARVRINEFRAKFDADNVSLVSQALVSDSARQLQQAVRTYITQKYGRMSQELLGSVADDAEGLIRDINIELAEKVWDAFQNFKEKAKESPLILPEGAKIAYTKGIRTAVLIEQKPQVRTVAFDRELVKTQAVADRSTGRTEHGFRYTLAFPYVYFWIVFDEAQYKYHEVYFRNRPLTSPREHLHLAPLPNVFRDKGENYKPMCMGADFAQAARGELTIARSCEVVVSEFWQRSFNAHLGTGNPGKVDDRIKNYAVWQQNSLANPLFVLEVNWPKGKTVKGILEATLEDRPRRDALDPVDEIIRKLLNDGVSKLSGDVRGRIDAARAAGPPEFEADTVARQLLEAAIVGHSKRVFEHTAKT